MGFRPLVYRVAKKFSVCGTVRNVGGYVDIMVQADNEAIEGFLKELQNGDNGQAQIVKLEIEEIVNAEKHNIYSVFVILESGNNGDASIIPPDLPVCVQCQKELLEETDRRHLNPFISCMSCGPRYTIMDELPYDRDNTTMVDFKMCPDCQTEYTNTEDRRLHAQTISCYDCGPYLIFQEKLDKLSVINELANAETLGATSNKTFWD